jgi:type IV secretory pathway VirJ component
MKLLPLIVAGLLVVAAAVHLSAEPELVVESLPIDRISYPDGEAKGVAFLFSQAQGWTDLEDEAARTLTAQGAVVVGVSLPGYYASLSRSKDDCLYLVSEIEDLSRQLHRRVGISQYHPPLVAGVGDGATLALAIAAQTPNSTIAETVAIDPGATIPLPTVLCTPAPKTPADGGTAYGLTAGDLPNPVEVVFTGEARPEGRRHAADLKLTHPAVQISETSLETHAVLPQSLSDAFLRLAHSASPLDLPIIPLEAKPAHKTMAIIYSGDGGWRDIDQKLAGFLQEQGVPVVGVDALRYFWTEKSPEDTASDLSRIMSVYRKRWQVDHVLLVGYSFGADILPATYRLLPQQDQDAVSMLSLLAPSHSADFEIAVTGWLGMDGEGRHGDPVDDLRHIQPSKIQCIHGAAEDDSACPAVRRLAGSQVLARPGGHHFDGDYAALSRLILDRMKTLAATN